MFRLAAAAWSTAALILTLAWLFFLYLRRLAAHDRDLPAQLADALRKRAVRERGRFLARVRLEVLGDALGDADDHARARGEPQPRHVGAELVARLDEREYLRGNRPG